MFEAINIINAHAPSYTAPFQGRLVDHWRDIKGQSKYPQKRDFRPQNFAKFLSQFAVIEVGRSIEKHQTRLLGAAVSEVLGLQGKNCHLLATRNPFISNSLQKMLEAAARADKPSYYRMSLDHDRRLTAFDFTAVVLPFSSTPASDTLDILVIAFDFSGSDEVNTLDNLSTPLIVPANRAFLIQT